MADLATAAGLPRPEIEERGDCVTVRFRRGDYSADRQFEGVLTEQQNAILALLRRSDRTLALREVRSLLGQQVNERRVREDLASLKVKGLGACAPERDLVGVFGFADRDIRAGVLPGSGGDWLFSGGTRRPGVGFGKHSRHGRRFRDGRGCAGGLSPGLRGVRACAHAA